MLFFSLLIFLGKWVLVTHLIYFYHSNNIFIKNKFYYMYYDPIVYDFVNLL